MRRPHSLTHLKYHPWHRQDRLFHTAKEADDKARFFYVVSPVGLIHGVLGNVVGLLLL